jgi:hypothetical protein
MISSLQKSMNRRVGMMGGIDWLVPREPYLLNEMSSKTPEPI